MDGGASPTTQTHYIAEQRFATRCARPSPDFERDAKRHGLYRQTKSFVTIGATEALFVALFGILNPGDEVIVPTPAFVLYEEIIGLCRGRPSSRCDTTQRCLSNRPRSGCARPITPHTKAIVLNSPNNPTGCIYTAQSLAGRPRGRGRAGTFLSSAMMSTASCIYTEQYHSFAEFRDLRKQILVVQSFSKPYAMTGWRMGYLLADAAVKERLELLHQFMVVSAPDAVPDRLHPCIEALRQSAEPMRERLPRAPCSCVPAAPARHMRPPDLHGTARRVLRLPLHSGNSALPSAQSSARA